MAQISAEHMHNLMAKGASAFEIAERYGYTVSGVRGMVSRYRAKQANAETDYKAFVDFDRPMQEPTKSEQRIISIGQRGQEKLDQWMQENTGRIVPFLYTSDHHWPYQDDRAISLNIQISALIKPEVITDGSDFFDFDDYTHWNDRRSPAARLWGSDIQRPIDLHANYHTEMIKYHKNSPLWVWLWGNHDIWLYEYLMTNFNGTSYFTMAHVMEELETHGTIFTGVPSRAHYVKMNKRLKFLHGVNASSNPMTVAKNTLEQYAGKSYEMDAGQYYNVVYGHDHRSGEFSLHGVTALSSGCNSRLDMPYLNTPANWQQGVVIGHFQVGG